MSDAALLRPLVRPVYPERVDDPPANWLDETGERYGGGLVRSLQAARALRNDLVPRVRAFEAELGQLDDGQLRAAARDSGKALRGGGFRVDLVARAFAVVNAAAQRVLGKRFFDVQLQGGWVLLQGMIAEMETGEGKTLTATLPTCTAALAGLPVHVITVNDYLVTRDCGITRPLYEALGLSVGTVTEKQTPQQRQAAYACDITYGSNKTIVFDYLRDRITLGSRNSSLRLRFDQLGDAPSQAGRLLLRGLSFAIVDEADSVLVDEARTPLIISAPAESGEQELAARQGIAIAQALEQGRDYQLHRADRRVVLTESGKRLATQHGEQLGGIWNGRLRREEMVTQALSALYLFARDEHYLVREGKIEIIDEYTGRTMADRSWERGLHQLIEVKEDCEVTAPKEPLSRISYQRFFRRYLLLAGMSGTASEVATELGVVYGLPIVKIPTNRPSRRVTLPARVLATEHDKWQRVAERVRDLNRTGRPVLLGTRSVAASEQASEVLAGAGLSHRLLNAKQDGDEAEVVAQAGARGRITIATNMAGRGTDIQLAPDVAALGGLHVILTERHDSKRIDRQLAGRCARQGDPGFVEAILSMEDSLMVAAPARLRAFITRVMRMLGPVWGSRFGAWCMRLAQRQCEAEHSRIRRELLKIDRQVGKTLAFSGTNE